jgi:hypothetical protein
VRRLLVTEAHGLYKVEHDGWTATGATLDSALRKSYKQALSVPGHPLGALEPREPTMDELSMVDVLEVLLGRDRYQGGQIHTGIESA